MRVVVQILLVAAVVAAIAFALLGGGGDPRRPHPIPDQEAVPEPAPPASAPGIPVPAATAALVVRLRMPPGVALPTGAAAGYRRLGTRRVRPVGADGTVRFTDVPVGIVGAVGDAAGFRIEPATVSVEPNLPNEAVLVLEPTEPPK